MDGSFIFNSVPGGLFVVAATSAVGLSVQASGSLDSEAQVSDVTVVLEGSGGIRGIVRDVAGATVPTAQVVLTK